MVGNAVRRLTCQRPSSYREQAPAPARTTNPTGAVPLLPWDVVPRRSEAKHPCAKYLISQCFAMGEGKHPVRLAMNDKGRDSDVLQAARSRPIERNAEV